MHRSLAILATALLLVAGACGSAQLGRALEQGQRHFEARQWQDAINEVELGLRAAEVEWDSSEMLSNAELRQSREAHLLIGRSYRAWGKPAVALMKFDQGAIERGEVRSEFEAERAQMKAELHAAVRGPASARLSLVHRHQIPTWLHIQSVQYAVDGEVVFGWTSSATQPQLPSPGPVIDLPLAPGQHYLLVIVVSRSGPWKFGVRTADIVELFEGQTLDVSPLFIDRGRKGRAINENLDIDIQRRPRPGPPAPTAAGSGG